MALERVSRDEVLMAHAKVAALRGTCSRLQVGAVFSRGGRIISTGYNGAPAGLPHCDHEAQTLFVANPPEYPFAGAGTYSADEFELWAETVGVPRGVTARHFSDGTVKWEESGCVVAEHAERNAIAFSARHGVALEGSELHCTHAPCIDCARSIVNAGVKRVVYSIPYRLTAGVELLRAAGLEVVDIEDLYR